MYRCYWIIHLVESVRSCGSGSSRDRLYGAPFQDAIKGHGEIGIDLFGRSLAPHLKYVVILYLVFENHLKSQYKT